MITMDKYLNDVLEKIYGNQNLCKYLYYDSKNPLSKPDIVDTKILRTDKENQKIFVTPFSVDTANTAKTTLTIMINDFHIDGDDKIYENMNLDFVICCNVRLWELDDLSGDVVLRVNGIWHELNDLFKKKITVGIGRNNFRYGKIQKFNDYFWGYIYSLEAKDFSVKGVWGY